MGPKQISSSVLTVEQEAMIVAFRRHTLLSLDDCLYALKVTIPGLTRSSLHLCLQRHGISRLPDPEATSARKRFKAYPIGFVHIDIAEVRTEQGKLHLFVAIDRTSKFASVGLANTTPPISQVEELTWANETLEAYGITSCDNYPAVSKTVFRGIALQTGTATPGLSWAVSDQHTECGSHCKVLSNSTTNGTVGAWYCGEIGVGGWVARHGLTSEQYQATFDDLVNNQGMMLVNLSGYQNGGQARYAAIWRKVANGPAWAARHGLSTAGH